MPENKQIKVLHVFGRMGIGGAETRTVALMPLISKAGINFNYCTLLPGKGVLDEKIQKMGGKVFPCVLRPGVLSFNARFLKLLRECKPDIVHSHVHLFSGNIVRLAHKAGVKVRISHFRSMGDGKESSLYRKIYKCVMSRMIDRHATGILAVGYGAMQHAWGKDWRNDRRCRVIHNGLDITVFDKTAVDRDGVRSELGISANSKIIIYVARMIPDKAHGLLLDAAAEIHKANPDLHYVFAGNGRLEKSLRQKTHSLNIQQNVHFLGLRTDIPRLLKASDCFVLPSLREGLPGVVLEAIAAGLPVIATDLPGVREIAEHTDLIKIIPLRDKTALAAAIAEMAAEAKTNRGTQPFPREFEINKCVSGMLALYREQLDLHKR